MFLYAMRSGISQRTEAWSGIVIVIQPLAAVM